MLRVEGKKWREDEEEGIEAISDWVVLAEVMVKKKNQALDTMLWLWERERNRMLHDIELYWYRERKS